MRKAARLLAIGLFFIGAPPCSGRAQTPPVGSPSRSVSHAAHIAEAVQRFDIPAAWIRAVLRAESGGNPRAVSPVGAMGLMQIMPATWDELRVRHRLGNDAFDPRDNILAGAAYLRELHDRYGSVHAMLAAYNAGPGRYEATLNGRPLPLETRAYVAALAPIINGDDAAELKSIAPASARRWTEAPLFALQTERKAASDFPSIIPQPGDLFANRLPAGMAP